jgi:AraC-like DNA-binding protein
MNIANGPSQPLLCSRQLVESDVRHAAPTHVHEQGQLTYIERGVLSLETEAGGWAIPAGRLHWIPAGIAHASLSHGEVRFQLILVPDALAARLPPRIVVLEASPLLVATMERLRELSEGDALVAPLVDIVAHEVNAASDDAPTILLPASPRMREWALGFLAAPDARIGIDDAARVVAMSRRTFTRHFERDVGMSFSAWKRAAIVHRSVTRLAEGASVSDLAFDFGYESVSAFVAMFRKLQGMPPGEFRRQSAV